MLNFKFFLTEAVSNESKLTHLEHAEDHVINETTGPLALPPIRALSNQGHTGWVGTLSHKQEAARHCAHGSAPSCQNRLS